MNYGIVSTASIVSRFIEAIKLSEDKAYAISSRDINKAQVLKEKFGLEKAYGSYEEMYKDENVDIVYIATPNPCHYEEIMKALSYGKHVVCEKPMCLKSEEVKECFQYAKEKNLFLMEAQKSVFLPVSERLKEIIEDKELGKLRLVDMSSSFDSPKASWMYEPSQGGVVYGSANYTLEYLDYLIEPKSINVEAIMHKEERGAVDQVSMNIMLDDILISSKISMGFRTKDVAYFYFEDGYVEIENYWKARKLNVVGESVDVEYYPEDFEMIYEIEHIRDCIDQGLIQSDVMSESRTLMCVSEVEKMMNK